MRNVITILICLLLAVPCAADIITVDDDGPADFDHIQAAINNSNDGDTVIVHVGHYYENIQFNGKNITLRSTDPNNPNVISKTIIDGGGIGRTVTFSGTERYDSTLAGFTITGGYSSDDGGGIFGNYCKTTIANCIIKDNEAGNGGGGLYKSEGLIKNCIIIHNTANLGAGLYRARGGISHCTIAYNEGGALSYCYTRITNCIIWGNTGFQVYSCNQPTFCCIQQTMEGEGNINAAPCFIDPRNGNFRLKSNSPCIDAGTNTPAGGFFLDMDGTPRPLDGDNDGIAIADMGAYEYRTQVFLVSTDKIFVRESETALFTVSLLLDPQETIEVHVIPESGDSDITVQSGALLIFDSSNFQVPQSVVIGAAEDDDSTNGQTTITVSSPTIKSVSIIAIELDSAIPSIIYVDDDAEGDTSGSSWKNAFPHLQDAIDFAKDFPQVEEIHVAKGIYRPTETRGNREVSFQIINGVTIKGGFAGLSEPDPNSRDVRKYETILTGDLAGDDGDNFSNYSENSYHVVTTINSDKTSVFDGFIVQGGNANAERQPHVNGGGLYNIGGNLVVKNCNFRKNLAKYRGGGIYNVGTDATFDNCIVIDNRAMGGGGLCNDKSYGKIRNCLFVKNHATKSSSGGAVYNTAYSHPLIYNCTIVYNFATYYSVYHGGGIENSINSQSQLNNCILWGNYTSRGTGESAQLNSGIVNYCCIQGWTGSLGGTGNIGEDPCFVEVGYWDSDGLWVEGDYNLLEDSPCINTGNPNYVAGPNETDLDGRPRVLLGRIDMGAYEFNHIPVADAGPNQTEYAWIDGFADVDLDGCGSYDDDNDVLDYYWSWTIDGNDCEANGVNPTIELPVGEHTIELVVNDGADDSEPDEVVITVLPTVEASMKFTPQRLNCKSKGNWVKAHLVLPEGISPDDVDVNEPAFAELPQTTIDSEYIRILNDDGLVRLEIAFDRKVFCDLIKDDGSLEITVVGYLTTGQYFYSCDTIRIKH